MRNRILKFPVGRAGFGPAASGFCHSTPSHQLVPVAQIFVQLLAQEADSARCLADNSVELRAHVPDPMIPKP